MIARKVLFAVAALTMSATAFGTDLTKEQFNISATLSHDGKTFAAPVMVVKGDNLASMEMSGPNGYTFSLLVSDAGNGTLKVISTVDSAYGSMKPKMFVHAGQPASISIGDITMTLMVERRSS